MVIIVVNVKERKGTNPIAFQYSIEEIGFLCVCVCVWGFFKKEGAHAPVAPPPPGFGLGFTCQLLAHLRSSELFCSFGFCLYTSHFHLLPDQTYLMILRHQPNVAHKGTLAAELQSFGV